MNGVDIDVLVAVLAHRLDHLPPDLISRFLGGKHKMKEWTSALSTPVASLKTPLTFLQTAMRMMIDMMMMATNARTAASTATWEKRAATFKKKNNVRREETKEVMAVGRFVTTPTAGHQFDVPPVADSI